MPEPLSPNSGLGMNRSEEHTSELQSRQYLACRLLLEKKNSQLFLPVVLLSLVSLRSSAVSPLRLLLYVLPSPSFPPLLPVFLTLVAPLDRPSPLPTPL